MNYFNTEADTGTLILIVDDDAVTRKTITAVLKKAGYMVDSCENGKDAINYCINKLPDLVLLDLMMPGIDGYDTCTALRNLTDQNLLPIITLTGLNDIDSIDKAFESGSTDFITKPINWSLLTQRVKYALRSRELFTDLDKNKKQLSKALHIARIGYWEYDSSTDQLTILDDTKFILGLKQNCYSLKKFLKFTTEEEALYIRHCIENTINHGTPYSFQHTFRNQDGVELTLTNQGELSKGKNSKQIIGTLQDITRQVDVENKLYFHRYFDPESSLPNKEHLLLQLNKVIDNEFYQKLTGVIYLSLDKLRSISQPMGSDFTSQFILQAASTIQDQFKDIKEISRVGNTSICFLLNNFDTKDQIEAVCVSLIKLFQKPVIVDNTEYHTTISIGCSIYPFDDDEKILLKNAGIANKNCIAQGGSKFLFYTNSMDTKANELIQLEKKMRSAIKNNEFHAFFQPQIDTATSTLTGMEALARWIEPDGNMIFPDTFIPLAEENELIIDLGKIILQQACQFARYLADKGYGNIRAGVNLSALQFSDVNLIKHIEKALHDSNLPPELLEIEITENIAMTDISHAISTLQTIRDMGIKTSMDDFGTGYSSLSYLQKLPLDTLKIDQSFIRPIEANEDNSEIAKTIIAMGHSLNMHLIAEGAEEKYHYEFLKKHGCHEVQGYYFSKPVDRAGFEDFILKQLKDKF